MHKSNAWEDNFCDRIDCLVCASAGEEGMKGMCKKRSVIYETYCITCDKREKNEKEKILLEKEREKGDKGGKESPENENSSKRKRMNSNPKTNKSKIEYNVKYVGETARSSYYERSCEHVRDLKGLKD